MKTLSIIIPHHNSLKLITRLLKSIPNKSWIEIIVVDDRSSDSSKNELLKVIRNNANTSLFHVPKGKAWAGTARNIGLDNAKGDWVLFADADDYFLPNFTEILASYNDCGADVVFFKPTSVNSEGAPGTRHLRYVEILGRYAKTLDKIEFYGFYVPWSKLISRALIEQHNIRFDEVRASNDVMFSLKTTFNAQNIVYSNNSIYCVTESTSSLTKIMDKDVIDSRFNVACSYNDFLQKNHPDAPMHPMLIHLWRAKQFGFGDVWKKLKVVKKNHYPIFYSLTKLLSLLKRKLNQRKLNNV